MLSGKCYRTCLAVLYVTYKLQHNENYADVGIKNCVYMFVVLVSMITSIKINCVEI